MCGKGFLRRWFLKRLLPSVKEENCCIIAVAVIKRFTTEGAGWQSTGRRCASTDSIIPTQTGDILHRSLMHRALYFHDKLTYRLIMHCYDRGLRGYSFYTEPARSLNSGNIQRGHRIPLRMLDLYIHGIVLL